MRLRATIFSAAVAAIASAGFVGALPGLIHGRAATGSTAAAVPAGLQAAIDRTLMRQPESTPGGVTVRWERDGGVSFSAGHGATSLQPSTLGRADHSVGLTPGAFVFGSAGTTETLGRSLTADYRLTLQGVEQRFKLTQRPAGAAGRLILSQRISGSLSAMQVGSGEIAFRGAHGTALTYGALKVTDARGRVLPSRLTLNGNSIRIAIDDAGARYPLTIDPTVLAAPRLAASLTASGTTDLGYSIAISGDGNTAAVGVPATGEVLVYTGSGTSWSSSPSATLTASGSQLLGRSVAISGDGRTIVAGAPSTNLTKGEALVYAQVPACGSTSCSWGWPSSPTATLSDASASSGESFGWSVAISADGNTIVAGAPGAASAAGKAFLYANDGSGWSNTATATFTGSASQELGFSVALSADGRTLVTGAPGSASAGDAFVYANTGSGWSNSPTATFAGSGTESLGTSVAISADGDTVATGAPAASSNNGLVSLYTNSGSGWPSSASSTFNGSGAEQFGSSVAVSADAQTLVVGAPASNSDSGQVLVYSKSSGTWPGIATDTYTQSGSTELGYSVSVSADGQTIGAGAPYTSSNAGAANIYATSLPGYKPSATLTVNGAGSNDEMGDAVAISADGHTAVVGEPGIAGSDSSANGGEVLIFEESNGSWSTTPSKTYTGSGGEFLGGSVSVSADGQTVIAGAPRAGGSDQGAALVYAKSGGSWPSTATTTFTGAAATDLLGTSVSVAGDGQTLAVGEPGIGSGAGAVLVYAQAAGSWSNTPTTTTLTYPGSSSLGDAVAISEDGRTLVAGAPGTSGTVLSTTTSNVGQVDIWSESAGSWSNVDSINTFVVAGLGTSVAVSADGLQVVAGGPAADFQNASSGDGKGMVMLLSYLPRAGYVDTVATGSNVGDELGTSVAVSPDGHTVVAGAPGAGGSKGAIAVFNDLSSALPSSVPTTFQGAAAGDYLGGAVAVSGDGQTILAGSPSAALDQGNASLYTLLDATTTAGSSLSLAYSPNTRSAPLSATLSSGGTALSGATVDFTVVDSGDNTIGTVTPGTTNGSGVASVGYALPAGLAAGTYTIDASYAGDGQTYGASSDDSQTLTITQASQTVNFTSTAPTSAVVGGTYTPTATATSGLGVTFAVDSTVTSNGACTISGSTVTFVHAGTCGIDANQGGSSNYNSATASSPQTITVGPGTQTVAFTSTAPSDAAVGGAPYSVSATGGPSGRPVTFSVGSGTTDGACTITGSTVSFVHAGSCVVDADQAGDADYSPAPTVSQTLTVSKGSQTIKFTTSAPAEAIVDGSSYTAGASGGPSGEPVLLTVDPTTTNGACTITGSTVSFTAAGTCVIDANQAGDADYNAAATVSQTFAVASASSGPPSSGSTSCSSSVSGIRAALTAALSQVSGAHVSLRTIHRAAGITLKFTVPCAGRLVIDWHATARIGRRNVGQLIAAAGTTYTRGGIVHVKLKLTKSGRKLVVTAKRLNIHELASFTPSGGTTTSTTRTVTLKH